MLINISDHLNIIAAINNRLTLYHHHIKISAYIYLLYPIYIYLSSDIIVILILITVITVRNFFLILIFCIAPYSIGGIILSHLRFQMNRYKYIKENISEILEAESYTPLSNNSKVSWSRCYKVQPMDILISR